MVDIAPVLDEKLCFARVDSPAWRAPPDRFNLRAQKTVNFRRDASNLLFPLISFFFFFAMGRKREC